MRSNRNVLYIIITSTAYICFPYHNAFVHGSPCPLPVSSPRVYTSQYRFPLFEILSVVATRINRKPLTWLYWPVRPPASRPSGLTSWAQSWHQLPSVTTLWWHRHSPKGRHPFGTTKLVGSLSLVVSVCPIYWRAVEPLAWPPTSGHLLWVDESISKAHLLRRVALILQGDLSTPTWPFPDLSHVTQGNDWHTAGWVGVGGFFCDRIKNSDSIARSCHPSWHCCHDSKSTLVRLPNIWERQKCSVGDMNVEQEIWSPRIYHTTLFYIYIYVF